MHDSIKWACVDIFAGPGEGRLFFCDIPSGVWKPKTGLDVLGDGYEL